MRKVGMRTGYGGAVILLVLFLILSWCPALALGDEPEPPPIEEPKAMTLTANPTSIYLSGDTSIITAAVYNDTNCTEPIQNMGVWFNTSLGSITNLTPRGLNIAPDKCWAPTNESGMAQALLTAGLALGTARVYAWTGGVVIVNATVTVQFLQPAYAVALLPDNETKEANANENVTYYLTVKNIGNGSDSYSLNLTHSETEVARLNRTNISLAGGSTGVVTLTVSSYLVGNYTTTVEAASAHARANVTVTTVVKPFYNLTAAVAPDEPQIVAPGVTACYTVTVWNKGNAPDRFNSTLESPPGVTATVNRSVTEILNPEESEAIELTVSSAVVGVHAVNLTLTSQGNASVNATVRVAIVVTREGFELDTGTGTYPSIGGVHRGIIIPNHTIIVKNLYTYPSNGTGGHTKFAELSNATWSTNATWNGYYGDYLAFPDIFTLVAGQVYSYEIHTGSYPQIIHKQNCTTLDGSYINCTSFVDLNGDFHDDWIPAFQLFP